MSCSGHEGARANDITGALTPLPPTPIKLGAQHTIRFGVIRGRLVVSPFKAGGFLIGLYRLESARTDEMKAQ